MSMNADIEDPTNIEDPFALPDTARAAATALLDAIITGGRYRLPRRDGTHKPYGWQRVSNLVSAYSDQFGLRMWELGEVLQGIGMAPDLMDQVVLAQLHLMDRPTRNEWVKTFIEHAKEASGGNAGSNHGSMRHESVEALHAGLGYAHRDAGTRRALVLYQEALKRHQLVALPDMQERIVLVEELEACGRIDNVLIDASYDHFIADLKTQRRFWTCGHVGPGGRCLGGHASGEPGGGPHPVDAARGGPGRAPRGHLGGGHGGGLGDCEARLRRSAGSRPGEVGEEPRGLAASGPAGHGPGALRRPFRGRGDHRRGVPVGR
jgi:hypothetical protein